MIDFTLMFRAAYFFMVLFRVLFYLQTFLNPVFLFLFFRIEAFPTFAVLSFYCINSLAMIISWFCWRRFSFDSLTELSNRMNTNPLSTRQFLINLKQQQAYDFTTSMGDDTEHQNG